MPSFIQFELWKDCSQGCPFCCNRGQVPVDKTRSCEYVLSILKTLKPGQYDYIGLIGGEFFNGEAQLHMNSFNLIMKKIAELNPKKILLTTSLIYDMRDYLIPMLKAWDKVLGILDKIVICTSWDAKYRFKGTHENTLWFSNMLHLFQKYPQIELHTEIILTQHFIDLVNSGKWDIDLFRRVFNTRIDFIEPSSGLYFTDKYDCQKHVPGFFPTKESFIEFLKNMKGKIDFNELLSMDLRSEELYFIENGVHRVAKNRRNTDGRCELSDKTKKYDIGLIDSSLPMRKIVEEFMEYLDE